MVVLEIACLNLDEDLVGTMLNVEKAATKLTIFPYFSFCCYFRFTKSPFSLSGYSYFLTIFALHTIYFLNVFPSCFSELTL
jgi:hypothetical protein